MAKTLLHIGGGRLDLPSIRWAHGAGLDVVVTDASESAPAARLARRFVTLAPTAIADLVQLALELNEGGELLGAYAGDPDAALAVAAIGAATGTPAHAPDAVRATLDTDELAEHLAAADVAVESGAANGATQLDVDGILVEGAFVAGGILERIDADDVFDELGIMEPTLRSDERRSIYALLERAARAVGLGAGPVGARVLLRSGGPAITRLWPHFCERVTTGFVSPTALGKSPVQAWLGALGERGGPFDTMPTGDAQGESASAGWMALRAPDAGAFQGIEGIDLALASRALTGVCVVAGRGREIADPRAANTVVGYAYATGCDPEEVETRLRSARQSLRIELAQRSIA